MASAGKMIEFQAGGRTAQGYLVGSEAADARPALIVIHEWWGLNEHIKNVADRFATEGYVALAPDLYFGTVTKDPERAGELMRALDQGAALETLDGAVNYLKNSAVVSSDKIGVTGFCMGGTFALLLAAHNPNIAASAPFYGDVPSDDVIKNLAAPILFLGAQDDPWITMDKMERLRAGLAKFGKEGEVKIYNGVGHAFFNDTRPEVYNAQAAADAWQRTIQFLRPR